MHLDRLNTQEKFLFIEDTEEYSEFNVSAQKDILSSKFITKNDAKNKLSTNSVRMKFSEDEDTIKPISIQEKPNPKIKDKRIQIDRNIKSRSLIVTTPKNNTLGEIAGSKNPSRQSLIYVKSPKTIFPVTGGKPSIWQDYEESEPDIREARIEKLRQIEEKILEERKMKDKQQKDIQLKQIEIEKKEVDGKKITFDFKGNPIQIKQQIPSKDYSLLVSKIEVSDKELKENLFKSINVNPVSNNQAVVMNDGGKSQFQNSSLRRVSSFKNGLTAEKKTVKQNTNSGMSTFNQQNLAKTAIIQNKTKNAPEINSRQPQLGIKMGDKYFPVGSNFT